MRQRSQRSACSRNAGKHGASKFGRAIGTSRHPQKSARKSIHASLRPQKSLHVPHINDEKAKTDLSERYLALRYEVIADEHKLRSVAFSLFIA